MHFRVGPEAAFLRMFSVSLIIVMSWLAGSQFLGESKDYGYYLIFFDKIRGVNTFGDIETRFEPAFTLLAFVIAWFFESNAWVYGVIAFFALSLKIIALMDNRNKNIAVVFFVFFFLYFFRYFALYELTQLRACIGMSLVFCVFMTRYEFEIRWWDIVILIVACLFHYSATLFFLVYFIRPKVVWTPVLVFIAVLFVLLLAKYSIYGYFEGVFQVFEMYSRSVAVDDQAVALPVTMALDIFLVIIGLLFWEKNDFRMKVSLVGLMIGFSIYWSFLDYNVIAHRFRELTSVFALIYFLCGVQSKSQVFRLYLYGFIILNAFLCSYLFYIRGDFLDGAV